MPIEAEVFVARFPFSTSVGAIVAAVGWVCAGSAWAESPLTLTAAHNITHDSNFARTETPISDTINTTSLQLDLDKQYGRQTYSGTAKVAAVRYSNYGQQLNNDEKDVALGFSSELLSNWKVLLNGSYGQDLNQFENNRATDHIVKNIRTTKSALGQVVYGVAGIWAIVGSGGKNTLAYSVPAYAYLNYRQDTQGLKAVYYSSDLLNYSLGVRHVNSQYSSLGERIDEKDIDLATDWALTGLSQLHATVSWTQSKRQVQADRRFNGLTGHLNWVYTPHGLLSYGVTLYRTSNSDQFNQDYLSFDPNAGTFNVNSAQLAYNNRTTSASLYATLAATSKLSTTLATTWNRFLVEESLIGTSIHDTSDYHSYSLSAHYTVERWFKVSAGMTQYSQTKDAIRNPYSGHAMNLAATFILN